MGSTNIEMEMKNKEPVMGSVSNGMSFREKLSYARAVAYLQKTKHGVLNIDPKGELSGTSAGRR